ncbi:membrane cofactor protein [Enoplosus armatus]|uniref:membrane cofactor protein n=1 Tax=Enoplosus armatus TaxID=215367 RepID=UPI003992148C
MKDVGRIILVLSFALLASAQIRGQCSTPVEHTNTRLDQKYTSRLKFDIGDKVRYRCAEGFTPSGGIPVVECIGRGQWRPLTLKCQKQSCGNAGDLPNGQFEYEGKSFIGDKVYAVCNNGYTVKGLHYMTCKKSGWAGEFPSCEVSPEGEATCSTPAVFKSVSSGGDVSVHRVGDTLTFTCSQGFQLDGAQQITCGPGGQWQPQPPQCLPSLVTAPPPEGRCGVPLTIKNANLADKYITKTSFASGEKVYYVCAVGYVQMGGSRSRWCNKGMWSPLRLKCEPKSCGSAGEIENGQFTYTGAEFGDTATAVCDDGHQLVGQATRTCMSRGWDGRVPVCEAVGCAEPAEVMHAVMDGRQEPPYTYNSVVRYRCRVGTLTGERELWCTKDGTWSAPAPQCKEITCPTPNVPGAFWTGPYDRLYRYRNIIYFECYPGYRKFGPSAATCGSDGRWFPGLPTCYLDTPHHYWR